MRHLKAMLHRLRGVFRRGALESEMNAELQAHLDGLTERNIAAGMSPADARYAAQRAFGGMAQIAERARDERRSLWVEQLGQDVRHAVRSLLKSRSFTITAVLTLALGIGVNAALFSVFNMIALRPLPLKDPNNLVRVVGRNAKGGFEPAFNHAEYLAYRDGNRALDGLLAFAQTSWLIKSEVGSERDAGFGGRGLGTVRIELVSENYFSVLGGALSLGRTFSPAEFTPGAPPVIVLSHAFWARHFRRDPGVLGRTIALDRHLVTVIGVAVEEFSGPGPTPPAGWLPISLWSDRPADFAPGARPDFGLIGRLKPGITEAQAKAGLDNLAARRALEFPGENAKTSVRLERGLRYVNIPLTPLTLARLSPLFLGFEMVLVIACTNVANLLLARGISRQTEIGVRLTLGASRGRVVRQLLTENILLCLLGAGVGLGLGTWTLQVLQPIILAPFMPGSWFMFLKPTPDIRVLTFTALLTVGATLVAGLLPAWHAVSASLYATMRNDGTAFGRRLTPSRLRRLLVIVQVAVCLMLLSCAGVLARNFSARRLVDVGYDAHAVFNVEVTPNAAIPDRKAAFRQALDIVHAIPGVAASAVTRGSGGSKPTQVRVGPAGLGAAEPEVRRTSFVTGEFFETLGVPLSRGRTFRVLEQQAASREIVVSESLARRLWPGQEAVGKILAVSEAPWGSRERPAPEGAFRDCEVIGVARDIKVSFGEENLDALYLPFPLENATAGSVFVRPRRASAGELMAIVRAAEAAGVGVLFSRPLSAGIEDLARPYYGLAVLSGSLGLLALAMASVGLYGLMTFTVNQRTREIGIRMALGATMGKVVTLFVRQGMRLVAVGLALGLIGGGLFALLIGKILYGMIDAFDPAAFGAVTLLFAFIALFACWLPARRATRVDPVVALRTE